MNLLEIMVNGGIVMWAILLCSVIAAYVVLERSLVLRKARLDAKPFMLKLKSVFHRGDVEGVMAFCAQKDSPTAHIIRRGLMKHDQGESRIRLAVDHAVREEAYHLREHLAILASMAGVAPMLGLLGAVIGMRAALRAVETRSGVAALADLAGGSWEGLLTMAFGLIVGIGALLSYFYFDARVARFVFEMEVTTTEFLDVLEERAPAEPAGKEKATAVPSRALVYDEDAFFRKKG